MKQQLSSPSFADLLVGQRKVKQTFFSQIDKIIDWNPIRGIIEIAYTKGNKATGRPSYDSLVLFKTELLRTWYGLSDGEVEEQVNDVCLSAALSDWDWKMLPLTARRCVVSVTFL